MFPDSFTRCALWAARACAAGQTQLLSSGSDSVLQSGTRDLAPAGLARLCGGLHLHHPSDRCECQCCHTHMYAHPALIQTWARIHARRKIFLTASEAKFKWKCRISLLRLIFYPSQNFCSEAVCYSEMITRKIERNQLGRDHKSFTVQVTPVARQNWGRAHNYVGSKCQQVFFLATQRAQQQIRYVYTQKKKQLPVVVSHLHSHLVLPLLCSPASFPSLFLHLHPLFLLFCSSSLSASSASPSTTQSMCAFSWVTCPATWTGKAWSGPWRSPAGWRGRSRFTRLSTGSCLTWTWTCRERPNVSSHCSQTRYRTQIMNTCRSTTLETWYT